MKLRNQKMNRDLSLVIKMVNKQINMLLQDLLCLVLLIGYPCEELIH
jgi:hypothetical protein